MAESILEKKAAGLPIVAWVAIGLGAYFLISRFLLPGNSATVTPPAPIDTGGGPPGVGPCPTVTAVQCGNGMQQVPGVDANGCPTLSCQPITPPGGTNNNDYTIGVCASGGSYQLPCGTTLNQIATLHKMSLAQLIAVNLAHGNAVGAYNPNLAGAIDGMQVWILAGY